MKQVPSWDSHDAQAHTLFERQMEVYACYFEYTDHQIGRIVDAIDQIGQLDNTLIIHIAGDNGASAEGSVVGTAMLFVNGKKSGQGRIEKTIPGRYSMDTFDVGMDLNAAVGDDYKTPYKFTGTINSVTVELKE
jgi:arylsulfatase A-like enzyme